MKYDFLSIYDAAAIVEFSNSFDDSSMAIFISAYIALIIKMGYMWYISKQRIVSKGISSGQEELEEMGKCLGCEYISIFQFPDGKRV